MNAEKRTRQLLDREQVVEIGNAIKNAEPPPKKMTKLEALEALSVDIKSAIEVGHTSSSIAALLVRQGLQVSERQVSQLLREISKKKAVVMRK